MNKRIKMKEIAEEAGVSISTVSRVLSGKTSVNSETKNKIYAALNRLNTINHDLTKNISSRNILVISANLSHMMHFKMIDAINETAEERGYRIIIEITNNRLLSFDELYERVTENNVCGIIVMALMAKLETLEEMNKIVPVVYSSEVSEDCQISFVGTHLYSAYKTMGTYLVAQNRKHIGVLFPLRYVANDLMDAYIDVLKEAGIPYDPSLILRPNNYDYFYISTLLNQFFSTHPIIDAMICEDDALALVAINAARRNNLRIPEDIAILGFGSTFLSHVTSPRITSVNISLDMIGLTLCNALINHVEKNDHYPEHIYVDYQFTIQESTEQLPGSKNSR